MEIRSIPIKQLSLGRLFRDLDFYDLKPLGESLLEDQIQPLVVRPIGGDRYEVIVGSLRYSAARDVGLASLLCIVRRMNEKEAATMQATDAFTSFSHSQFEKAKLLLFLREQGLSDSEIAEKVHQDRSTIAHLRSLADLPMPLKKHAGRIDYSTLLAIESEVPSKLWDEVGGLIIKEGLNQKQARRVVKAVKGGEPPAWAVGSAVVPHPLECARCKQHHKLVEKFGIPESEIRKFNRIHRAAATGLMAIERLGGEMRTFEDALEMEELSDMKDPALEWLRDCGMVEVEGKKIRVTREE